MPTHYAFLLVEEFSHIAFSCAVEPLRIANLLSSETLYEWSFVSETGAPAVCSNGSATLVHHTYDTIPRNDRLFVLSGIHVDRHISPKLLALLRKERVKGTQFGGLCSAALIFAEAGFLNGQQAAIHWEFHDGFIEDYPEVDLVRSVFVADAKIITASGGTATADLMLHLIARDHGEDLAIAVADQMVYNAVRDSGSNQRVSLQSRHGIRNTHLAKAVEIMQDNLETPLQTSEIAQNLGISTRQLERLFGQFLNCSPKKYFLDLRLKRAQNLLIQTDKSVTQVAIACGFENTGHFSRVYRTHFGVRPSKQSAKVS